MQAATTAVSQNLGAGRYARAKRSGYLCLVLVLLVSFAGEALIFFVRDPLFSLYTRDPASLSAAGIRFWMVTMTFLINGTMMVGAGMTRGMGHSLLPMLITFLGACVFRIVWLFTVYTLHPSLWMLYVSYPISWATTTVAHFIAFHTVYRRDCPHGEPEGGAGA